MVLEVNGTAIEPTIFPDGTSQVWKLPPIGLEADVVWRFEREAELIHLAQLRSLLPGSAMLWMPYLPYARQDKPIGNDATFALRNFAAILNGLRFASVSCFDPHSNVAAECLENFRPVSANALISEIAGQYRSVCLPDQGALSRYAVRADLYGEKVRDQSTGRITSYALHSVNREPVISGSTVLVVDDLCDGGATFVLLGAALKKQGLRPSLYVSHGVFSKGTQELGSLYERIYTTDSRGTQPKGITVYESAPPHRLLQG